jgi:hypothetical protein
MPKRRYQSPRLVDYGSLASLTLGSGTLDTNDGIGMPAQGMGTFMP